MDDFRKKFATRTKSQFKEQFGDKPKHVVQQVHKDGDVVKLWRCGAPQSSVYMFYVCSAPNCLMTYGDMGECMWQRHYDMIPFIRGAIESLDYFSEKVPTGIKIREDYKELAEEWLAEIKQERLDNGHEWVEKDDEALEEIKDSYGNYDHLHDFRAAVYESCLCDDGEGVPSCSFYTHRYLWIIEGLKWFIQQLDGGKVLPYVEKAECQ